MSPRAALIGLALLAACGDDGPTIDARPPAVCGDMRTEPPEQCDDGNTDETDACRRCVAFLPQRTLVRWLFNVDEPSGFAGDGCIDVGAATVRVDLTGPATVSQSAPCERFQITFEGLAAGSYTAALTPLDSQGAALVTTPATTTFTATAEPNTTEQHTIQVPYTAWSRALTGTYLFLFRWAGQACGSANPVVDKQRVRMLIGGNPVNVRTMFNNLPGYLLDGSQLVPCVLSSIALAERAVGLPLGPATIEVEGHDVGGAVRYARRVDTFVGAGTANPVLTLDVPIAVDAGVDAAVDAP